MPLRQARARWAWLAITLVAACTGSPAVDSSSGPGTTGPGSDGGALIERWPARVIGDASAENDLPPGFSDEVVVHGLNRPTAVRFLPDGRLLVAEQRGVVLIVDDQPRVLLDLRTEVFNRGQQGLLGLAVDPDFAGEPYVYVAYTRDAPLGGTPPTYGRPGADDDECSGGRSACPASARISRFRMDDEDVGAEQALLSDWCISGPQHSIGTIAFAPDGALFAGGGDGADGRDLDYGQLGAPPNACSDPGAAGAQPDAETSEGGSLRSQDLLTRTDPVGLSGTIIRVDRRTGEALPDNPLSGDPDANAARIVAFGLRNPFRFTFRPGTGELWLADVGWRSFEEINRLAEPLAAEPANFGWPCFEGPLRQSGFSALGNRLCEGLYSDDSGTVTFPAFSFRRTVPTEGCDKPPSVLSAIAFYDGEAFPAEYAGALFIGDFQRACIWVMQPGADGLPDARRSHLFRSGVAPVDIQVGPDGALHYVDVLSGTVRRIRHVASD